MAKYFDFQFEPGDYSKAAEYTDEDSIILAIRNIMLSRPGNYPFHPSIGMNIKQYQFDLLDDTTVNAIKNTLDKNIAELLPEIGTVTVDVRKVLDLNEKAYLCISVYNIEKGKQVSNFILANNGDIVDIFNETH